MHPVYLGMFQGWHSVGTILTGIHSVCRAPDPDATQGRSGSTPVRTNRNSEIDGYPDIFGRYSLILIPMVSTSGPKWSKSLPILPIFRITAYDWLRDVTRNTFYKHKRKYLDSSYSPLHVHHVPCSPSLPRSPRPLRSPPFRIHHVHRVHRIHHVHHFHHIGFTMFTAFTELPSSPCSRPRRSPHFTFTMFCSPCSPVHHVPIVVHHVHLVSFHCHRVHRVHHVHRIHGSPSSPHVHCSPPLRHVHRVHHSTKFKLRVSH